MKQQDKDQLHKLLLSLDESGLVALSNKGLVRRAQKDLEGATVSVEEQEQFIVVKGPDWTVWMPPSGPKSAKDDTKATGITRQILAATIYLRDCWHTAGTAGNTTAIDDGPDTTTKESGKRKPLSEEPTCTASAVAVPASRSEPGVTAPAEEPAGGKPHSETSGEQLRDRLLALSSTEILKWSGKTLWKEIESLLKTAPEFEVECAIGLTMRLPQHAVEVRLLPCNAKGTRLLDELLTTGPKTLHKRWALMAVLALHQRFGKIQEAAQDQPDPQILQQQHKIIESTQQLLEGILATGVAHPSNRLVERLFTLSVSATAMQLPRLGHMLRALSSESSKLLCKEASADTRKLLDGMSQSYALTKALRRSTPERYKELAGASRTQYEPISTLRLRGAGVHPWRTPSGYEGITAIFWDRDAHRFLTWSSSRPVKTFGFDLETVYRLECPWTQSTALADLCRKSFSLVNGRLNALGRISSSQQTSVADLIEDSPLESEQFEGRRFTDWAELRNYVRKQLPIGIALRNPLDRLVVLEPRHWGERFFDEMQQSFCWQLLDENSAKLALTLAWNAINEQQIEFLEALKPDRDKLVRVLARISFDSSGTKFEPISFFSTGTPRGHHLLNPAFDASLIESKQSRLLETLRKKFGKDRIASAMTAEDDWDEIIQADALKENAPAAIRQVLEESESLLLRIAESGCQHLHDKTTERVKELATKLSALGLTELGNSLNQLCQTAGPVAGPLLWSDYLCRLHWQAISGMPVN